MIAVRVREEPSGDQPHAHRLEVAGHDRTPVRFEVPLSGGTDVVSIVTVPDRRVGADAEREREEGDRGEPRGPGERSQRVPHVGRETIQHQGVRWFRPEKRGPWTPCISSTFSASRHALSHAETTMAKKTSSGKPLTGRVALVAGATRGAGRGIARALGEAGATVYCTGRSVKGKPSPYRRPETIDDTAAMIKAVGGTAIALRVDHTNQDDVRALFRRIMRVHKRIDVIVDSVAGEDPLMGVYGFLWQADLNTADAIFRQGLTSRIITAKYGALAMMPAKRGLIVEVTENDMIGGGGNPMAQAVKMAQKVLPLLWAAELAPHGIAVMAVTPGFLRSESMLQHFGVTEDNWREAGKKDPNFLQSESPLFVGRAIAALAADPKVQDRTGMLFGSWELGRDYGLADYDGRRPDWGRHKIDFSVLPPTWIDLFRTGTDLEIKWLTTLAARTRKFRAKIPSDPDVPREPTRQR
jgi:NAD(P)-dependent dehydrogenase (short-subunit alcohol dehydrogenase family)